MALARGLGAGLLCVAACSTPELATVPTVAHPSNAELVVVEYPPPPAKVEEVRAPAAPGCAWRDGYWEWVGRRWEWIPGAWVVPPVGCRWAPRVIQVWVTQDKRDTLYYGRPRWYRTDGRRGACVDPPACAAAAGK